MHNSLSQLGKGKKVLSVCCRSDSAVKFKGFFLVCVELLIFLKIGRNFGPQVLKFLILGLISLFPKDSFHFISFPVNLLSLIGLV